MLLVVEPLARVLRSVHMDISPLAAGLIVNPHSIVHISGCMDKAPPAVRHVVLPITFVLSAVGPKLNALAVTQAFFGPLALVNNSVIEFVGSSCYQILF